MQTSKLAILTATASFMFIGLAAFNPAAANCDGCLAGDSKAIWPEKNIPVCWESMDTEARDRQIVQDAVTNSWQKHSGLTFTGWGQCETDSDGLRIAVDDSYWPRVLNFGNYLDGFPDGVQLNFNISQHPSFRGCAGKEDYCNKALATHEFGHALGFHHEQNRSDRPRNDWCVQEKFQKDIPNEQLWGPFDMASIMNYCSPDWNGGGELSAGDIEGIAKAYPQ